MIDPGQGVMIPPDTEATSLSGIDGLREEDVVLPISKKVADILAKNGVQAMLTRDTGCVLGASVSNSLRYRTQMAQVLDATLFVSIHANRFNGVAKGARTFYYGDSSKRLAQLVQNSMLESLSSLTDRGVRSDDFLYTLKNVPMPGIHIETGFIDNKEDAARLRNSEYQNKMAEAIASGILQYLKQQK
ncbi:N-acetylmuramoyl-L-alanine amidase [Trichocoleus sp. FACHB-90]|uniref:N-acetylmuramoyl-L-alanine amidase family protein n=2 Tax=Cyanophyceae TaxID=3028117 RepID=UPI002410CAE8|nr:N-acetylmuramoyl-L-alanine amidase [Trichocoleus sp. FACHB-90]